MREEKKSFNVRDVINSDEYKHIEQYIDEYVEEMLKNYVPTVAGSKIIHDPIWGSTAYSEWEMQIIDSPLFQRLRNINQVGLAMLTYPAARHSRFEHSLGVASAVKIMCNKINRNTPNFQIADDTRDAIVLAALLHDIGHCFYSHLSETVYGELEKFSAVRNQFAKKLELRPKPHEILSFMIVNTKSFKEFFFDKVSYPNKMSVKEHLFLDVGCMIIGQNIEKDDEHLHSYQTALINGPFDADKLDYIKRDSFTAGLSLQYDMERLFTKIQVHTMSENDRIEHRLVINFNGITAVEELTFCKIMLFSYIYYHQKVLISETMIKDYVFGLLELKIINKFSDFLRYTDSDILNLSEKQGDQSPFPEYGFLNLKELADNIRNRRLPKRCFEVSYNNVDFNEKDVTEYALDYCEKILSKCRGGSYTAEELLNAILLFSKNSMSSTGAHDLDKIVKEFRDKTYFEMLNKRREFYYSFINEYKRQGLNVNFTPFDIYIVFPNLVNYGGANEKVVLGKDRKTVMTINEFIKLGDWANSFNSNKWRGYVFVSDKIDREIAFKVSEKLVLQGKAKLKNPAAYLKGI